MSNRVSVLSQTGLRNELRHSRLETLDGFGATRIVIARKLQQRLHCLFVGVYGLSLIHI